MKSIAKDVNSFFRTALLLAEHLTVLRRSRWKRIQLETCDMCDGIALYQHPLGGLRCAECPKPETDNKRGVS